MIRKILLIFGLLCCFFFGFGQSLEDRIEKLKQAYVETKKKLSDIHNELLALKLEWIQKRIKEIALPTYEKEDIIVHHSAYSLAYVQKHKQARWVVHIITPDIIEGNLGRTNDFRPDSLLPVPSATQDDYWESGYDRGHLAPSADFRWSPKAVSESYYYTNMSPQKPDFNRGIWSVLEDAARKYVINNQRNLYVVTGGVLRDNLPTIGESKVSVPALFYKVLVDIDSADKRGIAFVMPNEGSEEHIMYYAVSIDSVEKLTGIDFFPALDDETENSIEAMTDTKIWQQAIDKDEAIPIPKVRLPRNCFNTLQAKGLAGKHATICGKVVSTKYSIKSGNTFLNLDKKFPNQIFTVTIWKNDRTNFTYKPEEYLKNKRICVRGDIRLYRDVPGITVKSEDQIYFLDEEEE